MIAAIKRKSAAKSIKRKVTHVKSVPSLIKIGIVFLIIFSSNGVFSFQDTTLKLSFSTSATFDYRQMDALTVFRIGLQRQGFHVGLGIGKSSKSIFITKGNDVLIDLQIGKSLFQSSSIQFESSFYLSKLLDLGSVFSNYLLGFSSSFGKSKLLFYNSIRFGISTFRIQDLMGRNMNYQLELGIRYVL